MPRPTVFLVGAGTSDYIGRALTPLLRRLWGCEVWAVPSTDLLTNLGDFVFADRPYCGFRSRAPATVPKGWPCSKRRSKDIPKCGTVGDLQPGRRMAAVCEKTPDIASCLPWTTQRMTADWP